MRLFYGLRRPMIGPALLAFATLSGCATYSSSIVPVERHLASGDPAAALAFLDKRGAPKRDRVLFFLDKAMLQRLTGDYAGSNQSFEEAKQLIDELDAASVSETTGSLIVNDTTRGYVGEPFEQALLHTYAALNYLDMGELDEARVEALQVDERLKEKARENAGALAEDPFARYLAGLIYEAKGESSDALIAYRKAYESYQAHEKLYGLGPPVSLKKDLLRLTKHLGLADEHKKLGEVFGMQSWPTQKEFAQLGEVVVFVHGGLAPIKREKISVIYPPVSSRIVSVALPHYQERPKALRYARATLGTSSAESETVENIGAIAVKTLESGMGAIMLRAVARAVGKHQLADRAGKENKAVGLVTNLAGLLTERADTRSWLTLPGEIQMVRMQAPPGDYTLHVDLLSSAGAILAGRDFDVKIEKGKKVFLSYHWISPLGSGRTK